MVKYASTTTIFLLLCVLSLSGCVESQIPFARLHDIWHIMDAPAYRLDRELLGPAIDADIDAALDARGTLHPRAYFNNFDWLFGPGGYRTAETFMRQWGDRPRREYLEPRRNETELAQFSERWLNATPNQIFALVDRLVWEYDLEQVLENKSEMDVPEFFELVKPVYVRLREEGFHHLELTG